MTDACPLRGHGISEQAILEMKCALALAIAAILTAAPAFADKPSWAGGGKGDKNERGNSSDRGQKGGQTERRENSQSGQRDSDDRSSHDSSPSAVRVREYFGDRHRTIAQDYYRQEISRGHCPPGLAKKHNGCMPPGQARKWSIGRPLPREVIYYEVPPALIVQFDRAPTGYRYVRVANDILLLALGTGMIIDAIQDLGRI